MLGIIDENGISEEQLGSALHSYFGGKYRHALIIPPDYTRLHSGAGTITRLLMGLEGTKGSVMPALGTHEPMTREQCLDFFGGSVDYDSLIVHNWRTGVERVGVVPEEYVSRVSEGLVCEPIDVELSKELLKPCYDMIISVGQVVPHEVVGMANYSKNIFVGCGGASMISASHMLGAFYGLERIMGETDTPVRAVFDYAQEKYLSSLPLEYVLTVTGCGSDGEAKIFGLFIGRDRQVFEHAALLSRRKNVTYLDRRPKKIVVYLDGREFKSTWLGNKAVYRTRRAIADGGELVVLAPGVSKFGEDPLNDELIREYGYTGRERILQLVKENTRLAQNLSVAAHLIHGSSDGRFRITYCTPLMQPGELEQAGYGWAPYEREAEKYAGLSDGFNVVDGEEVYYISNPALGLWIYDGKTEE